MRLSEAIRLGAMLRPVQEFHVLFDPATGGSCALGAAAEAIGMLDTSRYGRYLKGKKAPKHWRWLKAPRACPQCRNKYRDTQDVIIHLNNGHKWTRERIADWIETLEQAQSVDAVDPVVAEREGTSTRV